MSILKLRELIKDVKVAMFTTTDHDGLIRSRPLQTLDIDAQEGVGELWFFTSNKSPKVDEIADDQHVNLSDADPVHHRFVSVAGTATASRDQISRHDTAATREPESGGGKRAGGDRRRHQVNEE